MITEHDAAIYLAGIFDGEGHVRKPASKAMFIINTEESILGAARECLDVLGISYQVTRRPARREQWKPVTEIGIYGRDNIERFSEAVPLRSASKIEALSTMVAGYGPRPIPQGELERMYVEQTMSAREIAEECGYKHASVVIRMLERYGIPRRTTAEARKVKYWNSWAKKETTA